MHFEELTLIGAYLISEDVTELSGPLGKLVVLKRRRFGLTTSGEARIRGILVFLEERNGWDVACVGTQQRGCAA
jgi:hypothetical protein